MASSVLTAVFLTVGMYILLQQHHSFVQSAPTPDVSSSGGRNVAETMADTMERLRLHSRSGLTGLPRTTGSRGLKYTRTRSLPLELQNSVDDIVLDDEDLVEFNKRQSEDYGHMRFGKRSDQFDDYGHMRFGRSLKE